MSSVLVIYSEATNRIRRVVSPAPKDPSIHLGKGEGMAVYNIGKGALSPVQIPELQAEIVKQRGPIKDDRYAIIASDGKVLDVVTMDPLCDDAKVYEKMGVTIEKSATVTKRQIFDKTARKFVEPPETAEEATLRLATATKEAAQVIIKG